MPKSFLNQTGLPIGLRNNNPGNLRPGIDWQGSIGENGGFLVFKDVAWGLRAMAIDIGNDIRLDGLNTIRKLVYEYAPPSENNTETYITRMVEYSGFTANQVLPPLQKTLEKLIRAHMNVELGPQYSALITDRDIVEGLQMMPDILIDYFHVGSGVVENQEGIITIAAVAAFWWWATKI